MFGALKALSNSEKAVAIGTLVVAATAMVFTGHMTIDQWTSYTEWMAVVYVGGKTVQGTVGAFTTRSIAKAVAAAEPAPAEAPKPEATA
jgi:fluoride ion exporter CrcB/FEX